MQSSVCQERPARDVGWASSDRHTGAPASSVLEGLTDDYFVAENEEFLDAVGAALDQLTADCKAALRWSLNDDDTNAAIQAAEQSFSAIANICKEAGLVVQADDLESDHDTHTWGYATSDTCKSSSSNRLGELASSWSNEPFENSVVERPGFHDHVTYPPPAPLQERREQVQHDTVPMSPSRELVEVELTDLMTQSHEEMLGLQRVFEARMSDADRTHQAFERKHAEEMQSLQEELANSRQAMDRIKQELLDSTTRKLEDMHSSITASQRAIEAGMKDHAQYWKSICEELVAEKRDMAQKVAEERGKYTALKAHLAGHDDTGVRSSPHSRVRARLNNGKSTDDLRLCELSLPHQHEFPACGNQTANEEAASLSAESSSRLVAVPRADSVSEPSSVEVSPTHSSSSSKSGRPMFRRYYLAHKREHRVMLH